MSRLLTRRSSARWYVVFWPSHSLPTPGLITKYCLEKMREQITKTQILIVVWELMSGDWFVTTIMRNNAKLWDDLMEVENNMVAFSGHLRIFTFLSLFSLVFFLIKCEIYWSSRKNRHLQRLKKPKKKL